MDGRFLTAFVLPDSWDILGYKLKPFSLRHGMTLTALDSPLMDGDIAKISPEAVITFLRVCSSETPSVALKKATFSDKRAYAKLQLDSGLFCETVLKIRDYISACNTCPKTYTVKDGKEEKTAENVPYYLSMATALMARLHFSPKDAWECTAGMATWYLTAFAISEGAKVKIVTTDAEAKAADEYAALVKMQEEARQRLKTIQQNKI